ncbi:MAG: FHA domain-containing protein [Leptolyngbyaceae cyanobacterium bins.302]|nr:FHA domain-containing protein [Leptolyngbyaceae cyanobacterium bins.302]
MVNPHPDADLPSHLLHSSPHTNELEQRLGLYQVFLKLYENNQELLDQILDLENTDRHRMRGVWQYIQAGLEADQPYLVTNLLEGQTQKLFQTQHCWVIGRDRSAGLTIQDKRLSRRHALIQYVKDQGFYLRDLVSTNGTYLNGEPVRRPMLLKDGDRIRLGSLFFTFFMETGAHTLEDIAPEVISTFSSPEPELPTSANASNIEERSQASASPLSEEASPTNEKDTFLFPKSSIEGENLRPESGTPDLSTAQKADILDRFLNR